MNDTYFEILREGVNTTIQDSGRNHLYHIGITVSGASDQRNFRLANKVVNNDLNEAAKNLYTCLRIIKNKGYKSIAVEKIPYKGLGRAINDRLHRAAKFKTLKS